MMLLCVGVVVVVCCCLKQRLLKMKMIGESEAVRQACFNRIIQVKTQNKKT